MENVKLLITKIVGVAILIINSIWLWHFGSLYYGYHFTQTLYFFMYPDWVLYVNMLSALLGIILAVLLIRRRLTILKAILLEFVLIVICLFSIYF